MSLDAAIAPFIEDAAARHPHRPIVVGICGSQGSGKSTLAYALSGRLRGAVTLSLDDLYLTRAERLRLATEVHPLLSTRGVPGTHDVNLGLRTLAAIGSGEHVALPRFDKAIDDRAAETSWPLTSAGTRAVIFEGWCVGAVPQSGHNLMEPVNALERDQDPSGTWRRFANEALAGPYQRLFAALDLLVFLAAPSWDTVFHWRLEQEHALRLREPHGLGVMDDAAVATFVSHYERLTRHILAEMPGRADIIIRLDQHRRPMSVRMMHGA